MEEQTEEQIVEQTEELDIAEPLKEESKIEIEEQKEEVYTKVEVDNLKKEIEELKLQIPETKSEKEIELENKELELNKKERDMNIQIKLKEAKIETDIMNFIKEDADIDELIQFINKIKISNGYVPDKKNNSNEGVTHEQFKKMNYSQRVELMRSNEALYKKYINQ